MTSFLPEVGKALEELHTKKQVLRFESLEEARARFGSELTIASLGAIQKAVSEEGDITIRLLYDGTHGVRVNDQIRVRDQDACPAIGDVKTFTKAKAERGHGVFGLVVDIKDAHRLPPDSAGRLEAPRVPRRARRDGLR